MAVAALPIARMPVAIDDGAAHSGGSDHDRRRWGYRCYRHVLLLLLLLALYLCVQSLLFVLDLLATVGAPLFGFVGGCSGCLGVVAIVFGVLVFVVLAVRVRVYLTVVRRVPVLSD